MTVSPRAIHLRYASLSYTYKHTWHIADDNRMNSVNSKFTSNNAMACILTKGNKYYENIFINVVFKILISEIKSV